MSVNTIYEGILIKSYDHFNSRTVFYIGKNLFYTSTANWNAMSKYNETHSSTCTCDLHCLHDHVFNVNRMNAFFLFFFFLYQ